MSAKKIKPAIDIVLHNQSSNAAINKAIDTLWVESKGDLNYQCKEGYRFIDVLILKTLDYNNMGHSEKLISQFLKKHGKDFISIIENDITEDNPIALITRTRSSSILLKQLLDKIDFSKENIDAKPGLKMLTTTFKAITPSHFHSPSDFILVLDEKLSKYEHLHKFTNELKAAYTVSNLFQHKELNDEIKKDFSLISQQSLNYSNELYPDLNPNQFYIKVMNEGLNYINKMDSSEIDVFKSKIEKELICDLSTINNRSLEIFNNKFKSEFNLENLCKKLHLDDNVKIDLGYSGTKTLEEYNANLIFNQTNKSLDDLIDIGHFDLNQNTIQERVLAIKNNDEINHFKHYLQNLKKDHKQISIENYLFKKLDQLISNTESLREGNLNNLSYKEMSEKIHRETISMENLYMHIHNPLVNEIFQKVEKSFKKDKVNNFDIINQIAAIAQLEGIFPNRDNVLKNINKYCSDLLENKLILSANGEIIKNPALDDPKKNQEILTKQKLLEPLVNELKEIKSLCEEIFVVVDEKQNKKSAVKP
jgi:hypothetical protein